MDQVNIEMNLVIIVENNWKERTDAILNKYSIIHIHV